ncbi:hypothetical protein [Streptomyces sp. NPDC014995]|uniref:TerC family protein n=1 Tax=Streptomyces sp. NPDC014995 TaxID=3364936 RepID=UPI0036F73703
MSGKAAIGPTTFPKRCTADPPESRPYAPRCPIGPLRDQSREGGAAARRGSSHLPQQLKFLLTQPRPPGGDAGKSLQVGIQSVHRRGLATYGSSDSGHDGIGCTHDRVLTVPSPRHDAMPVRDEYAGMKFFVREAGKRVATPLLAVVAAVEAADVIFAVDSVPAVLAISDDPFIVHTSNAFAILGLRALYFLLAGLLDRFHYLGTGLALILSFIGVKLILQASHKLLSSSIPEIPSPVSLAVIVAVLAVSVALSIRRPRPIAQDKACSAPREENGSRDAWHYGDGRSRGRR